MSREERQEAADYAIRGERFMREPRGLPIYGGQAAAMAAPLHPACKTCEQRAAIIAALWETALVMRLDCRTCEVWHG